MYVRISLDDSTNTYVTAIPVESLLPRPLATAAYEAVEGFLQSFGRDFYHFSKERPA